LSGWEDDREYRGSLLQQFTQARDFLRNHLRFSRIIDRSGSSEQPEIPFRVLEEALANALIHREYVTEPDHTVRTEGVQVEIFSDRIEIKSPGRPPVPLNTEHPKSHPRNSQIMRIFYLAGYVEKLGTGIKRMQRLMWEAGLKDLDIRSSQQTFTIILFRPVRSLALLAPAEADMQAPQRTSQAQAPRSPLPPTFLLPPSQIRKLVVSQIARGTSQTQVPRPPSSAQSQKVYDNPVTPIPLFSPDQSNPDRNNKQLVRPVPRRIASPRAMPVEPDKNNKLLVRPVLKASPRSRKPLSTTLYILLITAVVLAVMVSAYAVDKQSYLLTAMSRHEPASTTIKIASDFPASGLDTIDGLPLQNGVQMAITEANKELFLPGYTLTLVAYNDVGTGNRPDPQVGANNLKQAIADNLVAGVIGPYNSSVALKELSLANQAPLALLSPSATFPCLTKSAADDPDCTGTHDFAAQMRPTKQLTFFRLAATDDQQGKAAADYFFQTKHYSRRLQFWPRSGLPDRVATHGRPRHCGRFPTECNQRAKLSGYIADGSLIPTRPDLLRR